jgi:hypothetical protein
MAEKKATDQASSGFPTFRGEPGASYGYTLPDGSAREIRAKADGTVTPERPSDIAFLDGFGVTRAGAFDELTIGELRTRAEAAGVDLAGAKTKADIRARLEASSGPAAPLTAAPIADGTSVATDEERAKAAAEDAEKGAE